MLDILPQLIINGLIAGALYALLAIGLSLMFGILKYINFAHADIGILGGYFFYYGYVTKEMGLIVSGIFAIIATIVIGLIIKRLTYDPLKHRPPVIPMLSSIGVVVLIQNGIQMIAGSDIKSIPRIGSNYALWDGKITFTDMQLIALASSVVIMSALVIFLKKTKTGKAIRAVSDNPSSAAIVGINPEKVVQQIFIIGTALCAYAGIFIGYEFSLHPTLGTPLIVKAFVPVIFGGVGNIPGTILGAFLIGIIENLGIGLSIGNFSIDASYKDAFAFIIMILILIFKPTGLFGEKNRV